MVILQELKEKENQEKRREKSIPHLSNLNDDPALVGKIIHLINPGTYGEQEGGVDVVVDGLVVAPNDTAYTRWSCQSGLANPVQIVSTPPAPSNGGQITVLGKPAMRTRWMASNSSHKSGRCRY